MASSLNGTGITFSNGSTQSVAATGTVSSVATGNGLSGGTITTTGTLVVACPGFNTVGSYCYVGMNGDTSVFASGSNVSAGAGNNNIGSIWTGLNPVNNLSGTWRWMAAPTIADTCRQYIALACRIS